jgi:hypothetical protein
MTTREADRVTNALLVVIVLLAALLMLTLDGGLTP